MIKRALDIVVSSSLLLLLAPVFLIAALWIRLDSRGPAFYRGVRTGRHGRPFRIFKFRTMTANAEKVGGTSTAETDPRITRAGRFLRKHKIDELPNLISVLKGDMSLVGPRPEVEEYTSMYSEEEKTILSVRPGITDWASIHFRNLNAILAQSDDPDCYFRVVIRPEKNRMRLHYVRTHSLRNDLKIVLSTFRALLSR